MLREEIKKDVSRLIKAAIVVVVIANVAGIIMGLSMIRETRDNSRDTRSISIQGRNQARENGRLAAALSDHIQALQERQEQSASIVDGAITELECRAYRIEQGLRPLGEGVKCVGNLTGR